MPGTQRRATRSGQRANRKPFRILDLPDELIVRIINHSVITSSRDDPIFIMYSRNKIAQPAITRACRLFRVEGLRSFYKHSYFEIVYASEILRWLEAIGRVNASSITHVQSTWIEERSALGRFKYVDFINEMQTWITSAPQEVDEQWSAVRELRVRMHDGKVNLGSWIHAYSGRKWFGCQLAVMQNSGNENEWMRFLDLVAKSKDAPATELERLDFWILE